MDTPDINPSLVEVFQSISHNQSTGILYVYEGENIKYLYFENGKLIYLAFYQSKAEKIGRALVSSYKISENDFQKIMEMVNTQGVALKDIVLQNNMVTPTELKSVTRTLVEDEFCEMFTWRESQTSFQDGEPDPQIFNRDYNTLKINIDVDNLIKWIQKKVDENFTIYQWVPSRNNIYALIPGSYDRIDEESLSAIDKKVAEFLDGNYTIENICYQLRQDYYKIGKSVVKLMTKGLVELASGEGPTTGISQEIRMIQEQTDGVSATQQTLQPSETPAQPVQPESSAAEGAVQPESSATQETVQPEAIEDRETMDDNRQLGEQLSSGDSAKNILVYESHTKRNLLIAAGAAAFLLFTGIILYFVLRETAADELEEANRNKADLIKKREFNTLIAKFKHVKAREDADDEIIKQADREINAVLSAVNTEAEEALRKARKLIDENKLEEARSFLEAEQKVLGRSKHSSDIAELISKCSQRIKEYNEVLSKAETKFETKIKETEKNPEIDAMLEIAFLIDTLEDLFKGYKLWEEKKDVCISKLRKVIYSVEEIKKEQYEELLKDTQNLKTVEDEINKIFNAQIKHFNFLRDILPEVRRKVADIRDESGAAYKKISESTGKDPFTVSIEHIDGFLGKYSWHEQADTLRTEKKNIKKKIEENNELYTKGMRLYNEEKYSETVSAFSGISPLSKHHTEVTKRIPFLNILIEKIEGWKDPEKRDECVKKLKLWLSKKKETFTAEHRTLVEIWIDRIEKYDEKSQDEYKKALEIVNRSRSRKEITEALEMVNRVKESFPNSPGGEKAQEKYNEIDNVIKQAREVDVKVDALVEKKDYDLARTIKEGFTRKYPPWVEDYISPIPVYVEVYPAQAEVIMAGKKTTVIEYDDKGKAKVTASCPGFTSATAVSVKKKGKIRELIILNRKADLLKQTKRAVSAGPVLIDQGIVCTYGSGIDVYSISEKGKLVWSNPALEIASGQGIRYSPRYNRDRSVLYILGQEKLHMLDAETGLSKKDMNLGTNAETPPFIAKDPLIGMRFYLYYGTFSRNVVCINSDDLSVRWNDFKAEGIPVSISQSPERDDIIVAGCKDQTGSVYFINFRSGRREEGLALGSPMTLQFMPYKGKLLAPVEKGAIACIDVENSRIAWESPALDADKKIIDALVADGRIYAVVSDGKSTEILAYNPEDKGKKTGSLPSFESVFSDSVHSCTYDGGNRLYIITHPSGEPVSGVWVYNLKTEKIEWQFFEKDLELYPPVFSGDHVYFMSKDGRLIGFQAELETSE